MRNDIYKILSTILAEADSDVQTIRHEVSHSLTTVAWLFRLTPHPPLAVQIAALCHDLDRYFKKYRVLRAQHKSYDAYKLLHTKRSAELTATILQRLHYTSATINAVRACIIGHEQGGGSPQQQLLTAADSLSFFESNIIDYVLQAETMEHATHKIQFMYFRVSLHIQAIINKEPFVFKKIPLLRQLFLRSIRKGKVYYANIYKK